MRTVLRTLFGVSINIWRLAGDILKITCSFPYCNHHVHREFLITLYIWTICLASSRESTFCYDLAQPDCDSSVLSKTLLVSFTSGENIESNPNYCPTEALRVPAGWDSQILRQSAHEGGKVVSPTHRPPLPTRNYSWYSFLLEAESTPGP
jgi:hypothetical protein